MVFKKLKQIYYKAWAGVARAALGKKKFEQRRRNLRFANRGQRENERDARKLMSELESRILKNYEEARSKIGLSPREVNILIQGISEELGRGKRRVNRKEFKRILRGLDERQERIAGYYAGIIGSSRKYSEEESNEALRARLERIRLVNQRRVYKGRPPLKLE